MKIRTHLKSWKHQLAALKFLFYRSFGALYLDMGGGKTKVMVDLIVNRGFKVTLIVAPKKVCRVWKPEFIKHAPNEPIVVLDVSNIAGDRKAGLVNKTLTEAKSGQVVIVCNYDSIWREPFKRYLLKLKIDCVICDESHRIKSPASKCSRMLQILGRRVANRYLMTGTPLGQSPLDIYAQYRFLAPEIFGTSYEAFKEEYANWVQKSGFKMLARKNPFKNLDQLHDLMFSCAFNMEVENTLPPTQDILIEFDMSAEAQRHYKELKKEGCLELAEGNLIAGNVLAVVTRLQQLTSGYLPVEAEDGSKLVVEIDDSRVLALKELLEDIPPDEPVVVFCKYRKDIKNIRRLVHEMGWKSSEVSGRRDTLDNWTAGLTKVLVVQIAAGAEGIDLTRARYCVYYTLTHSLIQYKQSRKRIHRPNQTRPVIYYKFVAKMSKGKTIDELIVKSLDNNEEVIASIMMEREV